MSRPSEEGICTPLIVLGPDPHFLHPLFLNLVLFYPFVGHPPFRVKEREREERSLPSPLEPPFIMLEIPPLGDGLFPCTSHNPPHPREEEEGSRVLSGDAFAFYCWWLLRFV